jgi:hypothetical protein
MALSLEKLWKDATDDAVLGAAAHWDSLNEEARQVVIAEAKRRGLAFQVPTLEGSEEEAAPAPTTSSTVWMLVALAVVGVAALGYLV